MSKGKTLTDKQEEDYRVTNARKSNSKRFPNGYIYILCIKEHNLYKIGVSKKPRVRIRNIQSTLPFESETIYLQYFADVYQLEEMIHERFEGNKLRKEWYRIYEYDVKELKDILNNLFLQENN